MKHLYIFLISLFPLTAFAQTTDFEFYRSWGSLLLQEDPVHYGYYDLNPVTEEIYVAQTEGNKSNIYKVNTSGTAVDWISMPGEETNVYQIKISNQGNMYLTGTTTETDNFATEGAYLETPPTSEETHFFLMKMTADGEEVWVTYLEDNVGLGFVNRFDIDQDENIYFVSSRNNIELPSPCIECTPNPLRYDSAFYYATPIIRKFTADGEHAWSTYYGVDHSDIWGIYCGEQGLYVYGQVNRGNIEDGTISQHNYFGTAGAYRETPNFIEDKEHLYLSKFSHEGERLWSTYYFPIQGSGGSSGSITLSEYDNRLYVASHLGLANVSELPEVDLATEGAFLTTPTPSEGNTGLRLLSEFDQVGQRVWTTYTYESLSDIHATEQGIFASGSTSKEVNIATENAWQSTLGMNGMQETADATFSVYALDGTDRYYSSYYGYDANELGRHIFPLSDGGFYLLGQILYNETASTNMTTSGAFKETFDTSEQIATGYRGMYVSRFATEPVSVSAPKSIKWSVYPNPANNYLNISLENLQTDKIEYMIYDTSGRILQNSILSTENEQIDVSGLSAGVYILELSLNGQKAKKQFIKQK
ncbi:T9SS type A sorting domain-containing protein [Avrilella dinanensis]|uniref:Secretion system C-terminal sorting domain-containing protein n=1 Tax=Avrilella dinanensis TaxID=2008672 RepID=A0A2M9R351_9FLAO|nr:T9SS type A sorting domain-containing protein [Avrilella dinanensis]PJR03296.1 hypothetical protein CDL10_01370 [Avrilella dinanensis]